MARGSAGATLVVMTDDLDHGHRATSRLYRLPASTTGSFLETRRAWRRRPRHQHDHGGYETRGELTCPEAAVRLYRQSAMSRRWQASGPGVSITAAVTQRSIRRDLRP